MAKFIGFSLSHCVNDIAAGRVDYNDVEKIIARTAYPDEQSVAKGIVDYASSAWVDAPEKSIQIAQRLFADGKVDQPRLRGENPRLPGNFHWVEADTKKGVGSPEMLAAANLLEADRAWSLLLGGGTARPRGQTFKRGPLDTIDPS